MKDTKETSLVLTPAMMLEKAITTGANVDVLEKLLALQERWEAQQARKAFEQALADLRADLPDITKTKQASMGVGRPSYKYEDLSEMVDALSPVLSRHGLSFRWRTESSRSDVVSVTCILAHRDGHTEATSLAASHDHTGAKNAVQALGSTVTYLQRYTLKAALGIAAAQDDDAQVVSSAGAAQQAPPAKQPHKPAEQMLPDTEGEEIQYVVGLLNKVGEKSGTGKNGKPYTKISGCIDGQWYGTFDAELGAVLWELENGEVRLGWRPRGVYRDMVTIEPIAAADDKVPF